MTENKMHIKEQYPLVLREWHIGEIMGWSKPKTLAVMHSEGFPLINGIGRSLRVPRDKFFEWLDNHAELRGQKYED